MSTGELQCPACRREHEDWEKVGEQTTPTNFGYARAVEQSCGREGCDGTIVIHQ